LLTETRLAATGIRIENVAALTGSEADLNSQDYHLLKEDLIQTHLANLKIRFVYLTGQRPDGEVFFFADSESPGSEGCSPPGQIYTEVSDTLRQVFRTTLQTTEGPVSDRWGIWVSGFVPFINPKTGTLVAVLTIDVDARDWDRELIAAATVPVLTTGVIASILVLFFILQQRTQRVNLSINIPPVMVSLNTAIPFGLVMNELVGNSLKHAFPEGREGTLSITGNEDAAGLTITISDNGIGMPGELDIQQSETLGLKIVSTLVQQLNGTIERVEGPGTTWRIVIPKKAGP